MFNHIKFYKFFNIKIKISLVSKSINTYKTKLYYKNKEFYICKKNYEVFFNCKIITKLKKQKIFRCLFLDNKLYNEELIVIDKSNSDRDRPDMKIIINNELSFGLEFFEKHHFKIKNDPENNLELNRIRRINEHCNFKFTMVFDCNDINNSDNFNQKFKIIVDKSNELIDIKDEKKYCINGLLKHIPNKELCEMIYDAHQNPNESIISIDYFNNNIIAFKDLKYQKQYLKNFKCTIKKQYEFIKNNNNLVTNLAELGIDDSDSDFDDNVSNNNFISEEDFIKKYYIDNKLTFEGFQCYINELGKEYLININERFKLIKYNHNIFCGFIDGLHDKFNDFNKIFGI